MTGTPDMKARLRAIGPTSPIETPEAMGRRRAEDTKRNAERIRCANLKIE
jgi:hypothetical protein